jgi:hypothetical protein
VPLESIGLVSSKVDEHDEQSVLVEEELVRDLVLVLGNGRVS